MQIRIASMDDFDAWIQLVVQVKESFPGFVLEDYQQILAKKIAQKEAIIAKEEMEVLGVLLYSQEGKELEFLAVDPNARKHGVATGLVKAALKQFKTGTQICVITYREGDPMGEPARKLYAKLGFQPGEFLMVFDYPCQRLTYLVQENDR